MLRAAVAVCLAAGIVAGSGADVSAKPGPKPSGSVTDCGKWICSAVDTGEEKASPDRKAPSGTGKKTCKQDGKVVPCYDADLGWFSKGCYYKQVTDKTVVADLKKQNGKKGASPYAMTCSGDDPMDVYVWLKNPPDGYVDPAVLAQRALDKMLLKGPDITVNPKPSGKGLVGMPVWMSVGQSPTTYGPNTSSASAGGVTVTATAKVSKVVWNMGDGSEPVVCLGPGTPYKKSYGLKASPDCGHVYKQASDSVAGGKFNVTATSTWAVDWQVTGGGGETGQLTEVRDSQVTLTIIESQAVN
ncbi:ATP/GTP-binding protein [Streptomyces fractus]|uniref:ATP/GTP-binding protein n=1 Tax=Streptomyces fractus TaxID=641806 RepID=UPI003CE9DE92